MKKSRKIICFLIFGMMLCQTPLTSVHAASIDVADTLPVEEKIYRLASIWKLAYNNFGLWELVPELDWDHAFMEYAERVINTQSDGELTLELERFLALLGEGHSGYSDVSGMGSLPLQIKRIEGRYFVTAIAEPLPESLYLNEIIDCTYVLRWVALHGK